MNFRTIELRDANGAVIHDGQIEGVELADIVEAVGGGNAT